MILAFISSSFFFFFFFVSHFFHPVFPSFPNANCLNKKLLWMPNVSDQRAQNVSFRQVRTVSLHAIHISDTDKHTSIIKFRTAENSVQRNLEFCALLKEYFHKNKIYVAWKLTSRFKFFKILNSYTIFLFSYFLI